MARYLLKVCVYLIMQQGFENRKSNMRKVEYFTIIIILLILQSCSEPAENNSSTDLKNELVSQEPAATEKPRKVILFFGNSITAAFGLESNQSFTHLIQARLDSLGYHYEVINAGVSGETTATGSSRVNWVIEKQPLDIFVLELGGNDGLRGVPVKETRKNLELIIDKVREIHPDAKILLAGMMVPPNMGPEYSKNFNKIFPELAQSKNVQLIPFILEHVAGIDSLNLPDGIHPNVQGEKIVMENVWMELKELL